MESGLSIASLRYQAPEAGGLRQLYLVSEVGTPKEQRFAFGDFLEIGRDDLNRPSAPGVLLVRDATVSYRHCVLTRHPDGHCYVRDLSRNGTRIDGRRLVPNVEVELRVGQVLEVGAGHRFVLTGELAADEGTGEAGRTVGASGWTVATVVVGDIRDYTVLVRRGPQAEVQQSVNRVFEALTSAVGRLGGTVKEYQGDAIFAFWEGSFSGTQAVAACQAALELDRLATELATDRSMWTLTDFPLHMDWALATGPVVIDSFGGRHPTGLSMIGEAVPLAFRLEKFASDETGRIVACRTTRDMAAHAFVFRDLGEHLAKGFDRPDHVFALEGRAMGGETSA